MLDVFADVEILFGGGRGHLLANGRRLVLDVDEPSTLVGLIGRRSLRSLAEELARAGLTLHVRNGDRLLLLAGRDAGSGILSRLLRLPRVQLSSRFAIRSALGRGRARP